MGRDRCILHGSAGRIISDRNILCILDIAADGSSYDHSLSIGGPVVKLIEPIL